MSGQISRWNDSPTALFDGPSDSRQSSKSPRLGLHSTLLRTGPLNCQFHPFQNRHFLFNRETLVMRERSGIDIENVRNAMPIKYFWGDL
jgi:hypothetical protein